MPKKVKAVVMTAPGKIEVQELPYPKLERGALILKMQMSGICGTDKHAYKGEKVLYGGTEAEQEIVYPAVHGHENVGTVVEIDPADRRLIEYHGQELKEGDRVTMCPNIICGHCYYCRHIFAYPFCAHNTTIGLSFRSDRPPYVAGGWAEYMFVPPKAWVYKIPEGLPDELAALSEIFVVTATLDRAKEFSRLEARGFGFADTVAVQGAGAMGCMHVAKARMLGAGQIIVLDESDQKLKLAKEFGADVTINVRNVSAAGAGEDHQGLDRGPGRRRRRRDGRHRAGLRRRARIYPPRRHLYRNRQLRRYGRGEHQRPSPHRGEERAGDRQFQSSAHRLLSGPAHDGEVPESSIRSRN